MTSKKGTTKMSTMTTEFKAAAALDADGALAVMLLAAFGISLATLMGVAERITAAKEVSIIMMALTAGVQIRNNVVFVGADHGGLKLRYPELVIEGTRETPDQFNFGALHALGHVLAHLSDNKLAQDILGKAGSCITGDRISDSEAGKINKEILESWTAEDRAQFMAWVFKTKPTAEPVVSGVAASVAARAKTFQASLTKKPSPASTKV